MLTEAYHICVSSHPQYFIEWILTLSGLCFWPHCPPQVLMPRLGQGLKSWPLPHQRRTCVTATLDFTLRESTFFSFLALMGVKCWCFFTPFWFTFTFWVVVSQDYWDWPPPLHKGRFWVIFPEHRTNNQLPVDNVQVCNKQKKLSHCFELIRKLMDRHMSDSPSPCSLQAK